MRREEFSFRMTLKYDTNKDIKRHVKFVDLIAEREFEYHMHIFSHFYRVRRAPNPKGEEDVIDR